MAYAVGALSCDDLLIVLLPNALGDRDGLRRLYEQRILVALLVGPGQITRTVGALHCIVDPAEGYGSEVPLCNGDGVGIARVAIVNPNT